MGIVNMAVGVWSSYERWFMIKTLYWVVLLVRNVEFLYFLLCSFHKDDLMFKRFRHARKISRLILCLKRIRQGWIEDGFPMILMIIIIITKFNFGSL